MPPWTSDSTLPTPAPSSPPSKPHTHPLADPDSHLALPTPPPSLPTSIPSSPESPFYTLSSLAPTHSHRPPAADFDMPAPAPSPAGSRRRKKRGGEHQLAHGLADLDEGPASVYSGAALPFPSTSTSDERPRSAAAGQSSLKSREGGTPGRSDSRRTASHSTTTTTTTTTATRKMERRQVRYSFPGVDHLVSPGPHAGSHRPRSPSTSSSRPRSPTSSGRKASTPLAPRSTRRSSSKHDPHSSSSKPQQPQHQQQQQRWRSSSYSTPATSSPFFRRSSSASSYAIQRRQSTLGDNGALLPAGSAPFLRPLVNAFAFFVVSAVAALTISAVLATSFSLTFYDDCSRRVGHVQRSLGGSIEGVRAGMGRMIGNARGALDLAVRAAGGTSTTGGGGGAYGRVPVASHSPSAFDDAESAERRRTTIPTVPQPHEPELELETDDIGGARGRSKRTRSSSAQADSSFAPAAPSPSKRRRPFFRASPPSFTPSSSPREATDPCDASGTATPGWRTDDDDGASLPFRVPPSTPRSSRAASPLRSGPSAPRALPPRPPLAVLIPSVIFALLFTLSKVLFQAWKARSCGSERRSSSSSASSSSRPRY